MALSTKLHSSFWSDDDVGRLDPAGKLAVVWVLTNKDMTNIGYLKVQARQFQFDTGLEVSTLQGVLKGLTRGFRFEDREGGLGVLSLNFVGYQFGESIFLTNSRLVSNLLGLARSLPEAMQEALCERYKGLAYCLQNQRGIEGVSKGYASPQYSTAQYSSEQSSEGGASRSKNAKNAPENVAESCTNVPHGTTPEPGGASRGTDKNGADGRPGSGLRYDLAEGVLRFLNEKTGQLFPATPLFLREIALRLREVNQDVVGMRRMIESRVQAWSGDAKMAQHLNPGTLFKEEKFPNYWGQREMSFAPGGIEERKMALRGKIEKSRANRQSAFHSSQATEEERSELKKWRSELEQLEQS